MLKIEVPTPKVRGQNRCISNNSKTATANLTKLHRKIEHNEKVCHTQELGSYAKVKVTIRSEVVPNVMLLINF